MFLFFFFCSKVQRFKLQTRVPVNHTGHRRRADRGAVWAAAVWPQPVGVPPGAPKIRYSSLIDKKNKMIHFDVFYGCFLWATVSQDFCGTARRRKVFKITLLIEGFSHRSYLVIIGSDSHSINQTLCLCCLLWANQLQHGGVYQYLNLVYWK